MARSSSSTIVIQQTRNKSSWSVMCTVVHSTYLCRLLPLCTLVFAAVTKTYSPMPRMMPRAVARTVHPTLSSRFLFSISEHTCLESSVFGSASYFIASRLLSQPALRAGTRACAQVHVGVDARCFRQATDVIRRFFGTSVESGRVRWDEGAVTGR